MRTWSRTALGCAVILAASVAMVASPALAQNDTPGAHDRTLLVGFADGASQAARASAHAAVGATVANRFAELGIDVVRLPDGLTPTRAESLYERLPSVEFASLNKRISVSSIPEDTLFEDQWGLHNTGQPVTGSLVAGKPDADIDAPEGWTAAFGNSFASTGGTRVAILDTGIDRAHVDLLGKVAACAQATTVVGVVVEGSCSDDNLHGTHVAGTVTANTDNGLGVAGVAPDASLAVFKFLNAAGVGFLADEIAGIRWAVDRGGAKVLSMSFGSYEEDEAELKALRYAASKGALLVAAAGNDGDDTKNYPAAYAEVMSVAATTQADAVASFSNCNADVEIAAPGRDIWSTVPGNGYGVISGTSMATPHVAGAAALVMSEKGLSADETRRTLVSTAVPVGSNGGRKACTGLDQVNLANALGGSSTGDSTTEAQPGAIEGKVSAPGRTLLASATVSCGSAGGDLTGEDGRYAIADVDPGSYVCTASKDGYTSKQHSVNVSSGETATANFTLRKR